MNKEKYVVTIYTLDQFLIYKKRTLKVNYPIPRLMLTSRMINTALVIRV